MKYSTEGSHRGVQLDLRDALPAEPALAALLQNREHKYVANRAVPRWPMGEKDDVAAENADGNVVILHGSRRVPKAASCP